MQDYKLSEIKKIGVETDTHIASFIPYIIGLFACLAIGTIFAFTYKPLSLAFVALSFYFAIFLLVNIVLTKRISGYVILGVSMLAAFIVFVIFFTKIEKPMGFMLFGLFPLAVGLTSFFQFFLLNRQHNN